MKYKGEFIKGSFHAHQVPIPDAKTNREGLKALQQWLLSYNPVELFTKKGRPIKEVLSAVPKKDTSGRSRKPMLGMNQFPFLIGKN